MTSISSVKQASENTISQANLNAAIEEYLHRMGLIGTDDIVELIPVPNHIFKFKIKKYKGGLTLN